MVIDSILLNQMKDIPLRDDAKFLNIKIIA